MSMRWARGAPTIEPDLWESGVDGRSFVDAEADAAAEGQLAMIIDGGAQPPRVEPNRPYVGLTHDLTRPREQPRASIPMRRQEWERVSGCEWRLEP